MENSKMQKMRLINAYELRDLFEQNDDLYRSQDIRHVIENGVKPVDAAPIMHGHWIVDDNAWHHDDDGGAMDVEIEAVCSTCGNFGTDRMLYCPFCGAKMDGDRDAKAD